MQTGGGGEAGKVQICGRKNTIKHEKWDLFYFLTTPSTPSKEFVLNPKDPLWVSNYCAPMNEGSDSYDLAQA
jgi:hypothetical protein